MLFRLIAGAGIFALGFYIGRQVGRMEPIIGELERARVARMPHAGTYDHEGTPETVTPGRAGET